MSHAVCPEHGLLKPCIHCTPPENKYLGPAVKSDTIPYTARVCGDVNMGELLEKCPDCFDNRAVGRKCGYIRPWY